MSLSECVGNFAPVFLIQETPIEFEYVEEGQEVDFETAIHYAKYGKFQTILLGVCGIIYATCAISTTTLSFVLPAAECDFKLSSSDKGKLYAVPLIGMIFGCSIWGSIADAQGRKISIMLSLLVDFLAAVISSAAGGFYFFLICRFFNGFGIIGATSIIFSYLGEFLSVKHRDAMLGRLEIFWNIGVIILPGVAWALLNRSFLEKFADHGNFSPWRIFIIVCSLPSLASLILLYFMPETPKFLISNQKYAEAKMVFQKIYTCNTGEYKYLYPVLTLEGECGNNNVKTKLVGTTALSSKLVEKSRSLWNLLKELCIQPHIKFLCITSFADFGLMASYYTLIMWFPEIFQNFNNFEVKYPNRTAGVCIVSQNDGHRKPDFYFTSCDPAIDNKVFFDTLIIGLSCIPTSVSLSYFMKIIGKKSVLVCSLVLSGLTTLSLTWVKSSAQTLVLSCIFESLTSILEAVLFCVVVDLFPTNLRAIALAATATSGRLGAIFGNMLFGILIDLNCCVMAIYLFGFLLIASGCLCLAVPRNENYTVLQ